MRHRTRRRRRLHSQIHRLTTDALHASGTAHVHQQSPTSATNQLRHRLCATRRHVSHRAAQYTFHVTGSRWIHQQSVTTATYQRSLHRLLLIRHQLHHKESTKISLLSFSQALNLRTISRPLPLPLHQQRFFFLTPPPFLSLSLRLRYLHKSTAQWTPSHPTIQQPTGAHSLSTQMPHSAASNSMRGKQRIALQSKLLRRVRLLRSQLRKQGTEEACFYANPSRPPPTPPPPKALKPNKIGGN
jgi:hypothetical protein